MYPELVKHIFEYVQSTDILGTTIESKPVFIFVIDANITQSDAQVLFYYCHEVGGKKS
jgi:hypothetical protein